MPEAVLVGQQAYELARGVAVVFAGGASLSTGPLAVSNYARLTAVFNLGAGAPAAGFPRLVQSVSGSTTDIVTVATQDTTQLPNVVYTIDAALLLPYAQVQFTDGGGGCTANYLVQGWPSGASGSSSGGGSSGGSVVSGMILPYGAAAAPSGYLLCDGTVYNIATYPTLGALLGSTYGGNGTTTFGVPNLQSRSPLGSGPGGGGLSARALGATGGEEDHVLTVGELATHSHVPAAVVANLLGAGISAFTSGAVTNTAAATTSVGNVITNANTGSDDGHNTMHPFQVVNFVIKT